MLNLMKRIGWFFRATFEIICELFFPLLIVVGVIGTVVLLALNWNDGPSNTDPKKGSVYVGDTSITKICDGTTLVYDGESTTTIANSPECQP